MQAHAIAGPWAAGERILVCVTEDPRPPALVRYASGWRTGCTRPGRRSASRPAQPAADRRERDRVADTLRLAEGLGGEAMTIPAGDGARTTSSIIAQANNVTQIIIGKSTALAVVRDAAGLGPVMIWCGAPATSASTSCRRRA